METVACLTVGELSEGAEETGSKEAENTENIKLV